MTAMDDVEVIGRTIAGVRTISIRNKTRDRTIAVVGHVGGACEKSIFSVTLEPLAEAQVGREGPLDRTCAYEIDSAKYVT
jgi:hypothetical protein